MLEVLLLLLCSRITHSACGLSRSLAAPQSQISAARCGERCDARSLPSLFMQSGKKPRILLPNKLHLQHHLCSLIARTFMTSVPLLFCEYSWLSWPDGGVTFCNWTRVARIEIKNKGKSAWLCLSSSNHHLFTWNLLEKFRIFVRT
jgi:hypothetical protein